MHKCILLRRPRLPRPMPQEGHRLIATRAGGHSYPATLGNEAMLKVNTHFFERFGGAILQSTLDLGVALATRNVTNGTIVVGLPGSMPQITATQPDQVKPTLKVPQGAAVSVFVARDLDFTKVEQ